MHDTTLAHQLLVVILPCQAQCDGCGASVIFSELVTARHFLVFTTKKCFDRTDHEYCESHCKSDMSTDRGIEKWFPGMLPKALQMSEKVCHCPRELLCRKSCVCKCKVTYFCVINHFQELFDAIVTWHSLY
jgi:hypothetical protein